MHRNILPFIPYRFKGETVPCPVCASNKHSLVARIDRRLKPLKTVMCDDCGLFYSNPMPTNDELTTYYQKEYRRDYQLALLKPSEKHLKKKRNEAKLRYIHIRNELTNDKLNLLDFGCGSGELVHEYASHGHDAFGFEPGAAYSSFAQRARHLKIDIQATDYQTASYGLKQFDAISMLHVLEHIPNPIATLSKAHDWLKDDGVLYIEVPNMQSYELKGFEHFHFAHVLGFSRDNLIHALRLSGFRVKKELAGTSIIAEKAFHNPCTALVDLKVTAERNFREYTQPISVFAYLKYHVLRGAKRLKRTNSNHATQSSNTSATKRNTNLAIPPL